MTIADWGSRRSSGTSSAGLVLGVLLVIYALNFLDRAIIVILAEPIKHGLRLTDTQLGLMAGLAFAVLYALLGIPIARFVDRPATNRVTLISLCLAAWSAMTVLSGLARNFGEILLARVGVGIGEAGCTPTAHSLIADVVPASKRNSALALYGAGVPLGTLLGLVFGGLLADRYGWRNAFIAAGAPGVIVALLILVLIRDPRRNAAATVGGVAADRVEGSHAYAQIRELLSSRPFLHLLAAASLISFLGYGTGVWTPVFYIRLHGLTPGQVGLWLGLCWGISGMIGMLLGGALADRLSRSRKENALAAPAIGLVASAPVFVLVYSLSDWRLAFLATCGSSILSNFYYGPVYATGQRLAAAQSRALASAILIFAQNMIGLGLGPLAFGALSDALAQRVGGESVRWAMLIAACLHVVPAWFLWRSQRLMAVARVMAAGAASQSSEVMQPSLQNKMSGESLP